MRSSPHPRIRVALIAASGVSIAVALISFALAFTVDSPARSLRPLIQAVDSMYTPVYVSMAAAGLLLLSAVIAIVSSLHGNRAVDLAGCATFLAVLVLSLVSLALAASIKTSTETALEATLRTSLAGYGPGNVTIYKAWDDMQGDLKCCGVRTNMAQENYQMTPWYRQFREGSSYSVPKIPNSCCSKQVTTSQMADCTTNLVSVPAQNKYMNPVGCFEAVQQMTDAFTNRYIIISVLLFTLSGIACGLAIYHLLLLSRLSPGNASPGASEGEKQLCSGGGSAKKQHLEFAYANHAAALSLSRTSLASGSTLHSSASRLHAKSPVASVYNGSGHRSPSPASSAVGARQGSASRPSNYPAKYPAASSAGSVIVASSNPPSPPIPKDPPTDDANKRLPTPTASSTLPVPVALKAQPIRSSARGGKQPANQRSGSMPPASQRAISQPANQRAKSPPANQRSSMPDNNGSPANQRTISPPASQKTKTSPAEPNYKVSSPTAAIQRATMPSKSANQNQQRETSPTTAVNRASSTLPNSAGAARQTTVLAPNGKRESNF